MQDRRRMNDPYLATYLNDHLAGAVTALELVEQLEKAHAGAPLARALSAAFRTARMQSLHGTHSIQSSPRRQLRS